jgi:hypothetical protein
MKRLLLLLLFTRSASGANWYYSGKDQKSVICRDKGNSPCAMIVSL